MLAIVTKTMANHSFNMPNLVSQIQWEPRTTLTTSDRIWPTCINHPFVLISINVGILTTGSYVDPVGLFCGGKLFLFPQNKP
jgi:hypothetical protein